MHRIPSANIVAVTDGGPRKVLKIRFARDGSIYCLIPQFLRSDGIIARVKLAATRSYPTDIYLPAFGKTTSHIVKFSHHADGRAHFSQDRRVLTSIKRRASPLDVQRGHLFTLMVEPLSALPVPRSNDPTLTLKVDFAPDPPRALKLVAFRYPAESLRLDGVGTTTPKPVMTEVDGELRPCFLIGPPKGYRFDSHVLLLTLKEMGFVSSDSQPSLIFLGGFDETPLTIDPSNDLEFLAAAYPSSDYVELTRRIGSIDYPGVERKDAGRATTRSTGHV